MPLPTSPNTTYVTGTPISSADLNAIQTWLAYVYNNRGNASLGDGSDGSPTFDGSSTVLGLVPSSSVYTMSRPLFCVNLTATGASTVINTNGYPIFVRGTLATLSGAKITANGAAGSGVTPGAAGSFGTLSAGAVGGGGGTSTNGFAGGSGLYGLQTILGAASSGLGGTGGNGSAGTGGTAGGTLAAPVTAGSPRVFSASTFGYLVGAGTGTPFSTANFLLQICGGGGGGGGAFGGGNGGGGGAGGNVLAIGAGSIVLATATDLQALGGNGGNAVGTNAGGGGGGGGGTFLLAYGSLTITGGGSISAAVNCAGGLGGTKNGTGVAGTAGAAGFYVPIQIG